MSLPPGRNESLLADLERDACWTSCRTGLALELGRLEDALENRFLGRLARTPDGVVFMHLERVRLHVAGGVHDVLQVDRARRCRRSPAPADSAAWGWRSAWTGSSSWASRNTSPVTGPVPPATPVPMPPSTPFPVKSLGSNGFSFRSIGGMSLGMSVGATTVWNPLGGGLAATTTSGGGWSGGGLGGGGGLRNTMVVSTGRFFIALGHALRRLDGAEDDEAVDQERQNRLSDRALILLLGFDQVLEHATTSRGRVIVPGN